MIKMKLHEVGFVELQEFEVLGDGKAQEPAAAFPGVGDGGQALHGGDAGLILT